MLVSEKQPSGYVNGTRVNNDGINIILGRCILFTTSFTSTHLSWTQAEYGLEQMPLATIYNIPKKESREKWGREF